ncbi:L-threonylcarbamoyladenylate synthase [Chloroflexota bacterium]
MYTASVYENRVSHAAKVLKEGGLVACPTDTVFALAADSRNHDAVARVCEAKGRPANSPLPLLVSDIAQVETVAADVSAQARALMERFWPGPLTLVLPGPEWLPSPLLQDGLVGVRQPDDPICCRLIEKVGAPITGTSANRTGEQPAMTADAAEKQLGRAVDYYLDAGEAGGAQPSTVVRISTDGIRVLREGPISEQAILDALARAA